MKLAIATASPSWYLTGQWIEARWQKPIAIIGSPFQVGRREGLSLTLPSPAVSNLHAEFLVEHEALFVRDLGSTNGTFRNGQRIAHAVQLHPGDLIRFANVPIRVDRREAAAPSSPRRETIQSAAAGAQQLDAVKQCDGPARGGQASGALAKLLHLQTVRPHFQRIVALKDMHVMGYEIRSRGRLHGLHTPDETSSAALEGNLEAELRHGLRLLEANHAATAPRLFIHAQVKEIDSFGLLDTLQRFRQANQAQPLAVEIREPEGADLGVLHQVREALRDLKIELAYDRFGCGQTRLADLAAVHPDYLKFDMQLIRDIHVAPAAQVSLLAHLVRMVQDLGIVPIAGGVECEAEHAACRDVGFQFGQGAFYGQPTSDAAAFSDIDLTGAPAF